VERARAVFKHVSNQRLRGPTMDHFFILVLLVPVQKAFLSPRGHTTDDNERMVGAKPCYAPNK
jgi:hypothetical protein